jgi:hypothetical protein
VNGPLEICSYYKNEMSVLGRTSIIRILGSQNGRESSGTLDIPNCCVLFMGREVKQSLHRPRGFQEFEVPTFQDNQHIKVVRLSAQQTGHLYSPRIYSWY